MSEKSRVSILVEALERFEKELSIFEGSLDDRILQGFLVYLTTGEIQDHLLD